MNLRLTRGNSLVIATHNPGKLLEFRGFLEPFGIEVKSAGELGLPEPVEDGATFEENARLKAVITSCATNGFALSDDSGIAVEALNGAPGIHSARWAGEPRDFYRAMARVEEELQAKGATMPGKRRGKFVCILCLANPMGAVQFFEGTLEGHLVWPLRGTNGFGYDPMFVPDGYDETFGEMDPAKKHAISHRARAFASFKAAILEGEAGAA
jgi:XTP/dITP diphosphohydrolase